MKQQKFKINHTTLFVYKSGKSLKAKMDTDPTTAMITTTVTGYANGKSN